MDAWPAAPWVYGSIHPANRLLTRAALSWRKPANLDRSRDRQGAVISWDLPRVSTEGKD